ncbi:hypothetical protein R1sor_000425 [Riccia sorocarpa]|uniref:Altered inheritance of mitochondria protein 24, mitochondrial n=1 Tax=Riccia sorocarpa TaxID=122646 RepID=A0ABD3GTW6_9MARC
MYNNSAPSPHGYPNQVPDSRAGDSSTKPGYQSSVPPSDHEARYSQAPPQQTFAQHSSDPSMYAPSAPQLGSFHGSAPAVPTGYPMEPWSISQFVVDTQAGEGTCPFEVEGTRPAILQVNFGCQGTAGGPLQQVYIKKGSMVGYSGEVKFEREGMLEHGFGHMLKKAMTSEGATLVKATAKGGKAQLYCADQNKKVTVLQLQEESIYVNGDDLLAFEPSLNHKIVMMKKISSIVSGGFFNVRLSGKGCIAILSHGKPLTLLFKTFLGRGSGESFQMKFDPKKGEGFVVIQPFEEIRR